MSNPSRLHGAMEELKGDMKAAAGHLSRNKGKIDEGRAMQEAGEAEKQEAKAEHAFTKHGERKHEAKAARHVGEAEYYANRAAGESAYSGRPL
ncbi:hypothetical protein HK104_008595 [Borealophlyctis nickersoniae]|nr:hypothetical protein HK104_008595 [Borealophlyctis nickersoniae]